MRKTLGIDLSRQRALAAVATPGDVRIAYDDNATVGLDNGEVLVGEAAAALAERDRCAGFFAELGRAEPFIISGAPYGAEALVAQLLRSAVDGSGAALDADGIALAFPDSLNAYQLDLLAQAARLAGVGDVHFVPDSVAQSHAPLSANGSGVAEGAALWLLQTDRSVAADVPGPTGTAPSTRAALIGTSAAAAVLGGAGAAAAAPAAGASAPATGASMSEFGSGRSMSDFADGRSMSDFGDGKEMSDFGGGRSMGDFATPKPGRARILVATATVVVVAIVAALLLMRGGDEEPVVRAAASEPTTTIAPTTTTEVAAPPPASGAFAVNATITAINTPPGGRGPQVGQAGAGTLNLVCEGSSCRGAVFSPSLQLAPVAFTGTIVDGVLTSSVASPITGECPGTMTETVKLTFDGDRVTGEASESPAPERCAGVVHVAFTYTFEGTRSS